MPVSHGLRIPAGPPAHGQPEPKPSLLPGCILPLRQGVGLCACVCECLHAASVFKACEKLFGLVWNGMFDNSPCMFSASVFLVERTSRKDCASRLWHMLLLGASLKVCFDHLRSAVLLLAHWRPQRWAGQHTVERVAATATVQSRRKRPPSPGCCTCSDGWNSDDGSGQYCVG